VIRDVAIQRVNEKLACLWRVRIQVIGFPCGRKSIIGAWVPLLVLRNGCLQLLLPNIAPGAHRVADNFDIKLRHVAKCRFKHARKERHYVQKIERERERESYNRKLTIYSTSSWFEAVEQERK
jgi:hypothetical protein